MPTLRQLGNALVLTSALGVIAFLALRPSPYLRDLRWMPVPVSRWADTHGVSRNVVAFFVLGLVMFLFARPTWKRFLLLCVFAAAVEVAQIWIPRRTFDPWDIAASIAGLVLAWPVAWILARPFRSRPC